VFDFFGRNSTKTPKKSKKQGNYKPIPLDVRISKISNEGLVTLAFNKPIYEIKNLSTFVDYGVFEINVLPGPDSNIDDLKILQWNVTAMTSKQMTFKLIFEMPLRISSQEIFDKLEVKVLKNYFILDEETDEPIKAGTTVKRKLPK
jgi:hypothetical protein